MALSRWPIFWCLLFFGKVFASQVESVINEISYCFPNDVEVCLVDHAIGLLLNVTDLNDEKNETFQESRSSSNSVEDILTMKLCEAIGVSDPDVLDNTHKGRADTVLRTFHRAWKYLIPFLIGVKLKLATFVPMVLVVLTLIAKSAFFSGNLALLLTGLNILLKFWYPKWSEEHHVYHDHPHQGEYSHQDSYGHHSQYPYSGSQSQQHPTEYDSSHRPNNHRRIATVTINER